MVLCLNLKRPLQQEHKSQPSAVNHQSPNLPRKESLLLRQHQWQRTSHVHRPFERPRRRQCMAIQSVILL